MRTIKRRVNLNSGEHRCVPLQMTTFGNWEANKNSTCLDGKEQGFAGVMCVFGKTVNNKFIGLMIIATPDEKKKDTTLFFVRVEKEDNKQLNANK